MARKKFSKGTEVFFLNKVCLVTGVSTTLSGRVYYYLRIKEKRLVAYEEEVTPIGEMSNGSLIGLLRE